MARPHGYRTGSRGGGNYTRGESRRGNKRGRSPVYPPGTPVSAFNITLSEDLRAVCLVLGVGNVSKGLRTAIQWAAQVLPLWAQDPAQVYEVLHQRVHGKADVKQSNFESFARLTKALHNTWDDADRLSTVLRTLPRNGAADGTNEALTDFDEREEEAISKFGAAFGDDE